MAEKRKLPATQIGPWTMLCILMRLEQGECKNALARVYGVDAQTMGRWQKRWGHETQHVKLARFAALQQNNLDDALKAVDALKKQVDRTHAILGRVCRNSLAGKPGAATPKDDVPAARHKPGPKPKQPEQSRLQNT